MAALDRPVVKTASGLSRPVAIRQPLPAIVSILHRVSGALLFLVGIPRCCGACRRASRRRRRSRSSSATMAHPLAKLVALVLVWAYLHHLLAGLRHLLLDVHIGLDLARRAARAPSCWCWRSC